MKARRTRSCSSTHPLSLVRRRLIRYLLMRERLIRRLVRRRPIRCLLVCRRLIRSAPEKAPQLALNPAACITDKRCLNTRLIKTKLVAKRVNAMNQYRYYSLPARRAI